MSNIETFINKLYELYPKRVDGCLDSHNHSELLAYEENDRSYLRPIVADEIEPPMGLFITNENDQSIYLLALDACFYRSDGPKRCDCLIFDNNYLCFIEFKIHVGRRQATQKLKDARNQLAASIEFFKSEVLEPLLDSVDYELEAYVVMQEKVYPRFSASRSIVFTRFLEQYGVRLFEQNTKSF